MHPVRKVTQFLHPDSRPDSPNTSTWGGGHDNELYKLSIKVQPIKEREQIYDNT